MQCIHEQLTASVPSCFQDMGVLRYMVVPGRHPSGGNWCVEDLEGGIGQQPVQIHIACRWSCDVVGPGCLEACHVRKFLDSRV